jgi:hypothetical protein
VYRVYRIPPGKMAAMDPVYQDNLAGRQSITVREAKTLGLGGEGSLVLIEGNDEGVARADALLKDAATALAGADAEAAYKAFRSQDEDAASGMGFVFGG